MMMDSTLVRPPYSREVWAARQSDKPMNVHVHVGESAWNRAKCWGIGHRIVVPLDLERAHENYDFDALAGLAVTLNAIDADLSVARQVACAICQAGATLVVVLHPDLPKQAAFFYGAPA